MTVVIIFMNALRERIKIKDYIKMKEKTMAVLTSMCSVCRKVPEIRKYLRQEVLPPLKVTNMRPEQRQDACGEVVRLMTTVDVMLKVTSLFLKIFL
jgi:Guanine nucleotide exchange factor synembryn.